MYKPSSFKTDFTLGVNFLHLHKSMIPIQHAQELSELRLGIEQVTERELDMAKRLEDFIIQSQDQNAMLQAEVNELRNQLAVREEQLTSATFR